MGIKLEIGAGNRPTPGYEALDLYSKHPSIKYKMDAKKMTFKDGEIEEIYTLNTIEHFWWHEQEDLLKEWCRVLQPGGKLIVYTVDSEVTMADYYNGGWAKEVAAHPKSQGYTWPNRTDTDRNMWLNWKLHSTSNPGDAHHTSFTWEMMKDLMTRAGFVNIERLKTTPYILAVTAFKPKA